MRIELIFTPIQAYPTINIVRTLLSLTGFTRMKVKIYLHVHKLMINTLFFFFFFLFFLSLSLFFCFLNLVYLVLLHAKINGWVISFCLFVIGPHRAASLGSDLGSLSSSWPQTQCNWSSHPAIVRINIIKLVTHTNFLIISYNCGPFL